MITIRRYHEVRVELQSRQKNNKRREIWRNGDISAFNGCASRKSRFANRFSLTAGWNLVARYPVWLFRHEGNPGLTRASRTVSSARSRTFRPSVLPPCSRWLQIIQDHAGQILRVRGVVLASESACQSRATARFDLLSISIRISRKRFARMTRARVECRDRQNSGTRFQIHENSMRHVRARACALRGDSIASLD